MDDPNKRHHVFGNPNHNLDALVEQYGSEEAADRAIEDAVNEAYRDGKIIVDARGVYKQAYDLGGYSVIVAGRIVNGLVRIGSAWRQPETNIHFIGRYQPPKYAAPKYLGSYWLNTAQGLLIRPLDVKDHDA